MKQFSIIVPVYKVEKELPRCVESLLNQTYQDIEILLVDDGSPDRCPVLCDEYAKMDERIIVVHKENGGLSDARNAGIQAAHGEYIFFIDSDDYIELNTCERFHAAIQGDFPDIVVGEARRLVGNQVDFFAHNNLQENKIYNAREYVKLAIQSQQWYAPSWLNAYRRQFLIENELLFEKGILHEDMQYLPRVFLREASVKYVKGYFYNYVIREDSITQNQKSEKNANCLFRIYDEWVELFAQEHDRELYKLLQGFLIKCYINTCSEYKIFSQAGKLINYKNIFRYSLNLKEFIKEMLFCIFPSWYVKLKNLQKK